MIGRAARIVMLVIAGQLLTGQRVSAQTGLGKVAEAFSTISRTVVGLDGRLADRIDEQDRIWFLVARRLAMHPDLAGLVGREAIRARRSGEPNQQLVFLEALLAIACKNFEDGCALRAEVEGILRKDEEQDQRLDRLEQQMAQGGPRRHEGYY